MNETIQKQAVKQVAATTPKVDRMSKTTTLYDVGAFEIFWRNLLAGMSRTLGSILLYIVFIVFISMVVMKLIAPGFAPYLEGYGNAIKSFEKINDVSKRVEDLQEGSESTLEPDQVQGLLKQMQGL